MRRAFLALTLALASGACSRPPAQNWEEICERIEERSGDVKIAPKATDEVRDQITASFHRLYVDRAREKSTLSSESTDRVTAELVRLQELGAWREGSHLHLADFFLVSFGEDDKPLERWRDHLQTTVFSDGDEGQRCLGGTIKLLFEDITLHAGDETLVMAFKK